MVQLPSCWHKLWQLELEVRAAEHFQFPLTLLIVVGLTPCVSQALGI